MAALGGTSGLGLDGLGHVPVQLPSHHVILGSPRMYTCLQPTHLRMHIRRFHPRTDLLGPLRAGYSEGPVDSRVGLRWRQRAGYGIGPGDTGKLGQSLMPIGQPGGRDTARARRPYASTIRYADGALFSSFGHPAYPHTGSD